MATINTDTTIEEEFIWERPVTIELTITEGSMMTTVIHSQPVGRDDKPLPAGFYNAVLVSLIQQVAALAASNYPGRVSRLTEEEVALHIRDCDTFMKRDRPE